MLSARTLKLSFISLIYIMLPAHAQSVEWHTLWLSYVDTNIWADVRRQSVLTLSDWEGDKMYIVDTIEDI